MNRITRLVPIAGLVLMLRITLSWGGPPNPTPSDGNGNTAGGTNALVNVTIDGGLNTAFGSVALFPTPPATSTPPRRLGAPQQHHRHRNTATGAARAPSQ